MNLPKVQHTKVSNTPFIKMYLKVAKYIRKQNDQGKWVSETKKVVLPIFIYGKKAVYVEKWMVKGQKVVVDVEIESYKNKSADSKNPEIFLIVTNIEPMENSERATIRQKEWKKSREERQKKSSQDNKTSDDIPENENYKQYLDVQSIDEEMFKNVSIYEISDEDVGF